MGDPEKQRIFEGLLQTAIAEPMAYFSHDSDAHADDSLFALWERLGFAGYGMFWWLTELLHAKKGHTYDVSNGYGRLAHDMYVDEETCKRFVEALEELGLLVDCPGRVALKRVDRNAHEYGERTAGLRLGAAIANEKKRTR